MEKTLNFKLVSFDPTTPKTLNSQDPILVFRPLTSALGGWGGDGQMDLWEFKTSLVYIACFRPARAT